DVVLRFPPDPDAAGGGAYGVAQAMLDGRAIDPVAFVPPSALAADRASRIEITLVTPAPGSGTTVGARVIAATGHEAVFAPHTPRMGSVDRDAHGALRVAFDPNGEPRAAIAFDVFRDGRRVAHRVPGTTTEWRDPDETASARAPCYTVESV